MSQMMRITPTEDRVAPARQGIVKRGVSRLLDAIVQIRTSEMRERIPRFLRTCGYQLLPKQWLAQKMWQAEYARVIGNATPVPLQTSVTVGIIKDFALKYANYEAACMELGVPYKLVSITSPNWIEEIERSGCEAFLVWPSHVNSVTKTLFDERLKILSDEMGKILFPCYRALWLYESKRRTNDWLTQNRIPHPKTWVFCKRQEAMAFVESATLPLVFKTDLGSTASGVRIVRTKRQAQRLVKLCFGRGFLPRRHDSRDRAWGSVLFQEYIPNASEWRIIRIGDSFFGHQKLKKGPFHSGSGLVGWYRPPDELLDFCFDVTQKGRFLSMDLDVLETEDGRYLVNELQTVFGCIRPYQMLVDGKAGRYLYDRDAGSWRLEEGVFCQNACCSLRVATLLEALGTHVELPRVASDAVVANRDQGEGL